MKLVLLFQSLFGVAVLGRSIEPLNAESGSVTADEQRYRFRYQVADDVTGDFKSQTETRDGSGVVTGTYRVLQPDGCVRVVHYTADAMGFHPIVTYEGDCQNSKSIDSDGQLKPDATLGETAAAVSLKDTPISSNPSSAASLSRPVHSAVPGLNPSTTADRQDSIDEPNIPRPIQTAGPSSDAVMSDDPAEKFITSPFKIPTSITNLWEQLKNSTTLPASDDDKVVENAPVAEVETLVKSVDEDKDSVSVDRVEIETPVLPEIAPLTGAVQISRETLPESITTLLQSFDSSDPVSTAKKTTVDDPLVAEPSELSISSSPAVESVKEVTSVQEPAQPNEIESKDSKQVIESVQEESSIQVEADGVQSRETSDSPVVSEGSYSVDEASQADGRTSISSLAQSVLTSVQNLTSSIVNFQPLNLISNVSVQSLVPKPIGDLLQSFNNKKTNLTTTTASPVVSTSTGSPSAKNPIGDETEQQKTIEMSVTGHHESLDSSADHGIQSDVPAVPAFVSDSRPAVEDDRADVKEESGTTWNAVKTAGTNQLVGSNLEMATSSETRSDPAVVESSAPAMIVAASVDPIPAVADSHSDSSDLESIKDQEIMGDQPVFGDHAHQETTNLFKSSEMSQAENSAYDETQTGLTNEPTAESRRLEDSDQQSQEELIPAAVPGTIIFTGPIETGSFIVRHPLADMSEMEMVDRRYGTARSLSTNYGMRRFYAPSSRSVKNAPYPNSSQHQQHRLAQQTHSRPYGRFAPAAPSFKHHQQQQQLSGGYGMRNTPVQLHSPPTNSHYAVRAMPPKPVLRSPVYNTYV